MASPRQTVQTDTGESLAVLAEPGSAEELLELYLAGQDEAFTRLVTLIGDRLFGFLCRFCRDRHLAEDVYQIVLVKVAIHAGTFDRRARFQTWLYRIARNAALDELRKQQRRKTIPLNPTGEDEGIIGVVANDSSQPDELLSQEELKHNIFKAVETLPDKQREVFVLKIDGELTFEEIGEVLGCGKESAKSRMRYALKRLRNALGSHARHYGLKDTDDE